RIGEVVDRLQRNPGISELVICPHPRCRDEVRQKISGYGNLAESRSVNPDVAVVQNSSVITELLHRGVKAFHIAGYDWLPGDYYGFVEQGICPEVTLEELGENFWRNFAFDEKWRQAYSRVNPTAL